MKRIGILGGTFDPPHNGHLLIANEVYDQLQLDEVWFLPNQEPPHKIKESIVSNEDRLEMLERAIGGEKHFKIETIELERPGPSYTFDTIKLLKERHPDGDFYFIIGADMVEYLPKWYKIDELIKLVQFVGVNRPLYSLETNYPIQFIQIPEFNVSSSLIRKRLKEQKTTKYLLPELVMNYIKEKGLYGAE